MQNAKLVYSHIIPSFVCKWFKDTSATGYMRQFENLNKRAQDGVKKKLLCTNCEGLLNKGETPFAKHIFYPYVNNVLSPAGVVTANQTFKYENWLLYFAISLQWRRMITSRLKRGNFPDRMYDIWDNYKYIWRDFLNGERTDTGDCETHLIFLQNLIAGSGYLPQNINKNINSYLIRCLDSTTVLSKNKLGIYSKIGPIVIFTSIIPNKLNKLPHSKIKTKGVISTSQNIENTSLTNFIFIDRPNDVLSKIKFSPKQEELIERELLKNPGRTLNSMEFKILDTDLTLNKLKTKRFK